MIGELPELDNFFDGSIAKEQKKDDNGNISLNDDTIYIYLSKEKDKWMLVDFISIAVAGIGIHVSLPIEIELTAEELNNVKLRFVKKKDSFEDVLKEINVLVRWQERDTLTGKIKLGLHFPIEYKNDPIIVEILKEIKNQGK